MTEHKALQIVINYHGKDEEVMNNAMELTEFELFATLRFLSTIRISNVSTDCVVPMKNLHDMLEKMAMRIKDK